MVVKSDCRQALMMALMFKALQLAVGRVSMEDIEVALRDGETNLKRNDVGNSILSMSQLTYGDQIRVLGAEYPQFLQPNEEVNRFISQTYARVVGEKRRPERNQAQGSQKSEHKEVHCPSSIHEIVTWLERKGCFIEQVLLNQRTISAAEIQTTSKILTKLADELEVLRPDNISDRSYDIHMRQWRVYWNDLISEMKTVAARTTCSGAFVLTSWPYSEFLTTLAQTLRERIA